MSFRMDWLDLLAVQGTLKSLLQYHSSKASILWAQCLSHTGSAPAHCACSLPAHTAQALRCSTRNHPWPALGCLHLPGLSRSQAVAWPPRRSAGRRESGSQRGRLSQFAHPRALSRLQGGLAPRSKGKARAELRPARRQARLPHSRSLLLPGRER